MALHEREVAPQSPGYRVGRRRLAKHANTLFTHPTNLVVLLFQP